MLWSPLVRLTHWGMAALVLFNLFNDTGRVHRWAGYTALALVVCRLVYGVRQRRLSPARIRIPSISEVWVHVSDLLAGRAHPSRGHNPVGMWAALIMWGLVLSLGVTGWLSQLDRYWGDDALLDLHSTLAQALQIMILIHWIGVASMSVLLKQNLVRAMVTGKSAVRTEPDN
ncbi:MAG: cytochrome b/b6 domain-containing protein [Acidobacteriota bacterium]